VSVRHEPSEAIEEGFVIRQLPETGTELAEGETVRFWVSLGPPLRIVPDLLNRTEEEVTADLEAAELAVGSTSSQADETIDPGRAVTWRAGGEDRPPMLPKGTEVDVVLSSGPAPRTVPSVVGATVDQAKKDITELGLEVTVSERFSSTVDAGIVISTNPGGGATLARGDTVELVVSKGPDLVTVPDVSGMTEDEAIAALKAAGLVAGDSTGPAGGRVFDTDPGAGTKVERGSRVDLYRRR
ncbi:MAG: PASTA domain-containing protein, partial [Acidimicrobiales bacterium]